MATTEEILSRDAAWHPGLDEIDAGAAEAAGATGPMAHELRWWRAWAAAKRADWDQATALAEEGLGEPWSERERLRVALLHAMSGNVAQAEHVLSQVIQWSGDPTLLHRLADACDGEGLSAAAARFRGINPASR